MAPTNNNAYDNDDGESSFDSSTFFGSETQDEVSDEEEDESTGFATYDYRPNRQPRYQPPPQPQPFSVRDLYRSANSAPAPRPPILPPPMLSRPPMPPNAMAPPFASHRPPGIWFPSVPRPNPPPQAAYANPAAAPQGKAPTMPAAVAKMHNGKPVINVPMFNMQNFDTPRNLIMMARQGAGKTSMLLTILYQLQHRFRLVVVVTLSPDTFKQLNKCLHNVIIIDKWENPKSGNNIVYNILDSLLELTLMRERKIMVNGELIEAPEICLVLDDLFTDDTIKKDEVWSDIYKRAHRCGLTTLTGCHTPVDLLKTTRVGVHTFVLGSIGDGYLDTVHNNFFSGVDGLSDVKDFTNLYKSVVDVDKGIMLLVDSKSTKSTIYRLQGVDKNLVPPFTMACRDFYVLMGLFGKTERMHEELQNKVKSLEQNAAYTKAVAGYYDTKTGLPVVTDAGGGTNQPTKRTETKIVGSSKSPVYFSFEQEV